MIVTLPGFLKSKLTGLCGNFDMDSENDRSVTEALEQDSDAASRLFKNSQHPK